LPKVTIIINLAARRRVALGLSSPKPYYISQSLVCIG